MTFGQAIECAKKGMRIHRKGWNGKGQFIFWEVGHAYEPPDDLKHLYTAVLGFFVMFTAKKELQPGWLASQSDMLADDWEILT